MEQEGWIHVMNTIGKLKGCSAIKALWPSLLILVNAGAFAGEAWISGSHHPVHPHVVASDKEGSWLPEEGWKWVNDAPGDFAVVWQPGKKHRKYPHVVASDKEGSWLPEEGYMWAGDTHGDFSGTDYRSESKEVLKSIHEALVYYQPTTFEEYQALISKFPTVTDTSGDWAVVWQPGKKHRKYPHVVASGKEGEWRPEEGWAWVNNTPGDFSVTESNYLSEETLELISDALEKYIQTLIADQDSNQDSRASNSQSASFKPMTYEEYQARIASSSQERSKTSGYGQSSVVNAWSPTGMPCDPSRMIFMAPGWDAGMTPQQKEFGLLFINSTMYSKRTPEEETEVARHENAIRKIRSDMAELEANRASRMAPQYVRNYYQRTDDGSWVTHDPSKATSSIDYIPHSTILKGVNAGLFR